MADRKQSEDQHPTRRTAIKVALGLAGIAGLSSLGLCMREGSSGDSFGSLPFDVWRAIREALRTSPDHRIARSETLIAEGNILALYHFVRDEIVTYPSGKRDYRGDNARTIRWGSAATLRGGAGTPREKADLLAELLARAGHSVDVVSVNEKVEQSMVSGQNVLRPAIPCEPTLGSSQVEEWRDALKVSKSDANVADEQGKASTELSDRLLSTLPKDGNDPWASARPFKEEWRPGYASVRVKTESGTQLLTPLVGEKERSEKGMSVKVAGKASGLLRVEVALQAATMKAPNKRFDLVRNSWSADKLVGKQLFVQTLPACHLESWVMTRFCDVQAFIPTLTLQDPQDEARSGDNAITIGDAISSEGERIVVQSDGSITIGENSISTLRSTMASEVATLEISVSSAAFPRIDLKVNALDASGGRIEGLVAGDFSVREDGKQVAHLLTANRASPRVAVLVDKSGSMPSAYSGSKMEQYFETLQAAMIAANPNAILLKRPTDSKLWHNLVRATIDDPAFIVYITDGDVDGKSSDEILEKLALGPKAVVIGVHREKSEVLEAMANATSGKLVYAENSQASIDAIVAMLREHDEPSYRLRYSAPTRDLGLHSIVLSVPTSTAEQSAEYTVSGEKPAGLPQITGLYLTVKVGNQYEQITTLAGHSHQYAPEEISEDLLAEVQAALFGTNILGFEAAAPSSAIWLDDLISARLSIEPTRQAVESGNAGVARSALHSKFRFLPADLCQSVQLSPTQQSGNTTLSYQLGLRVSLYQENVVMGSASVRRRLRNMPTTFPVSTDTNAPRGCENIARQSARLAVVSGQRFDTDVGSALAGIALGTLDFGSPVFASLPGEVRDRWREQLRGVSSGNWIVGAPDAQSLAFYRIDKTSGEIISVLADGWSARANSPGRQVINEMMTLPNHMSARAAHAGIAVTLGSIENLDELLAGHAPAVNMVTSTIDAAISDTVPYDHFACGLTGALLHGPVAIPEQDYGNLASILALLGEASPFACPVDTKKAQ